MYTHPSTNPAQPGLTSEQVLNLQQCYLKLFRSVQLLLSCLVAVFCLAEVSLFCSVDQSVVALFRRASITLPYPPSDFLLSLFSLYPRFVSYCKCCISSLGPKLSEAKSTYCIAHKECLYISCRVTNRQLY